MFSTCPAVADPYITAVCVLGLAFCCPGIVWSFAPIAMTELQDPSSGTDCEYLPVELRPVPGKVLAQVLRESLKGSRDLCRLIYEHEKAECASCIRKKRRGKDACPPIVFTMKQWKFFKIRVASSRSLPQLLRLREQSGTYPPLDLRRSDVSMEWRFDVRQH